MATQKTDIVLLIRSTVQFPIEEILGKCISTLVEHTNNYRLIIVDDFSDESGRFLISSIADRFPNSILVRTHYQRWFTRAANLGLSLVRTPQAVLLNCDCVMGAGWLEELYAVKNDVEQSGKVGLVGSILSDEEPRRYALSHHPDYVTGHCWLLDMAALYQVSVYRGTPGRYLDETNPQMIHIRSDNELCERMGQISLNCVKAFKSAVGHISGQTWGHRLHDIPGHVDAVNERYV